MKEGCVLGNKENTFSFILLRTKSYILIETKKLKKSAKLVTKLNIQT